MKNLNIDWLTRPTGNPFVDTGGYIIELLWKKGYSRDILELIKYVANIYVRDWNAKLNSFFHNSTITQPAFKGDRKIEETLKYYKSLLEDKESYVEGYCQITGRRTKLFGARAENSILAGSYGFTNYHSVFDVGARVSKEVLIRMFFVPLGSVSVGGRMAVVSSNVPEFTKIFVLRNLEANLKSASSGGGIYKLPYSSVENALFHYADELLMERKDFDQDVAITLFHFSSYMQSPSLSIYRLPAKVFAFYRYANRKFPQEWKKFLHAHYYGTGKEKNAKYDPASDKFILQQKKQTIEVDYEEFKTWRNRVLHKLLNDKSLLGDFINWIMAGNSLPWELIQLYSIKVLGMKTTTVNKIKQLAGYFVDLAQKEDRVKRYLNELSQARSAADLRSFLLKLVRANYLSGNSEPLMTVEDYVNYLFADDTGWHEIRDLLLIAIYEELHRRGIRVDIQAVEEEQEM